MNQCIDWDRIRHDSFYNAIPNYTMDALERYVEQGIPPGGFLMAVLTNDLMEAMGRADSNNRQVLFEITGLIYNEFPADCWRHPERIKAWIQAGGWQGMQVKPIEEVSNE